MSNKFHKNRFIAITLFFFIVTLLFSIILYFFEYAYGNSDGIWREKDIIRTTYTILLFQSFFYLIIYSLFYSNRTLSYITFTLLFTLFLIFCLEKVSLGIINLRTKSAPNSLSNSVVRTDHELSVEPDSVLGVKAKRNTTILWLPKNQYSQFDSVKITIDSLSRRLTPKTSNEYKKYALFLGCSYTYGDGVSDDQTMPYYYQKYSPSYKSYNLGYLAYSPLHALARFQHESLEKQIDENDGFAVFTYINDHIDRVIPATRWIALTKGKFPNLNKESLKTEGLFTDRHRLYSDIIISSETSGIKQLFGLSYPKYHTKEHYKLVVDLLKEIEREYILHFKNKNFYVVIFPGNPLPEEMSNLLRGSNIKYFDYSKLTTTEDKMLPFDNAHPSPVLYDIVAKKLSQDIATIN